jgi:MoaA/NifB/PqqE/SkfB family radical SAM enzyme
MLPELSTRILSSVDPKILRNFAWNFGVKGVASIELFKRRMRRGIYFPPFLYISVLNSCNLRCQGCWVDVDKPQVKIDLDRLNRIVNDAREHGNSFFGILGGEPFLHPDLFDFLAQHPDCFFQIFTNGQLITPKKAGLLRKIANATPLISIEGDAAVSDERRGNKEVYARTLRGLRNCLEEKIMTGVATSVCQTNIDLLLTEGWLRNLIGLGVHYAWYHTYRPVGPQIHEELALRPDQARQVREFVVNMRCRLPIGLVDAYYDGEGRAVCPMATGISHHIGPTGGIEPCPIIQFATETVEHEQGIYETLTKSDFLRDFRETAARHTRGCIVLERPDLVRELAVRHGARDTTIRQTAQAELAGMTPKGSQYLPGHEVPEKHWMYRIAKSLWFNDFGVYEKGLEREESPARSVVPVKAAVETWPGASR